MDLIGPILGLGGLRAEHLLPLMERILADTTQLGNLRDWIAAIGDLLHRIVFKTIAAMSFARAFHRTEAAKLLAVTTSRFTAINSRTCLPSQELAAHRRPL